MQKGLIRKGLVLSVIVLLVGVSFGSSTGKIDRTISTTTVYDGSLLGYVNVTSGNPIEGALVRVYFHETYEEDYSDEDGYYHVTSIPICYCMKDVVCSKSGYKSEQVSLAIAENTVHDFILTPDEAITSSLSKSSDCIDCQVSDGYSLLRAKIFLFRVRVITNVILSSKLGEIPEIKEDCQELLDIVELNSPLYSPIICDILSAMMEQVLVLNDRFGEIYEDLLEIIGPFAYIFGYAFIFIIDMIGYPIFFTGVFFDCWDEYPPN